MPRIIVLTFLLGFSGADNNALDSTIEKIVRNYDSSTLVSISDSERSVLHSTETPSVIFTANNNNIILAEHFPKPLLLLIYYDDNPEILQRASHLMLDNCFGQGKILLITDDIDIELDMLTIGDLAIGMFCTTTNNFYSVDISRHPYFALIPSDDDGEYKTIEIPENYTINVRVGDKEVMNEDEKCIYEHCRLIYMFCEKFNLKLRTTEPITIDLRYDRPVKSDYKQVDFHEYNSLSVVVPNLKKQPDRHFYFLVPFTSEVWLLFGIVILLLVMVISVESRLRSGHFSFTNHSFTVFQMMFFIKIPQKDVPPNFNKLQGVVLLFFIVMITMYSCYLGSYLRTIEYESRFEILCSPEYAKRLGNLSTKFTILPRDTYFEKILLMDTKYGYCIELDIWDEFQHIQKRFHEPLFRRILDWMTDGTPLTLYVKRDSVLRGRFTKLYLEAYNLGLMKKWGSDEIDQLSKMHITSSTDNFSPFSLLDMKFPFQILGAGFMLGFVCFTIETQYLRIFFAHGPKAFKRLQLET